eukprot:c19041_g1_i1.p1 GENE.c19041_g1_i1~~c19041_g1_i1.p1  ORF type:complete len:697 (+),score=103.83 c19041_g1_i1:62-2152(+)
MSDVGYDIVPCFANSILSVQSIAIAYAVQFLLICSYEGIQGYLARRGVNGRFRLVLPFYRAVVWVFLGLTILRAVGYLLINHFFPNEQLEDLLERTHKDGKQWARWAIYVIETTIFVSFNVYCIFLVATPSAGRDALTRATKSIFVSAILHAIPWVLGALVPRVGWSIVVFVRLLITVFFFLVALRSIILPKVHSRKSVRFMGIWFGLILLIETLLYVDFFSNSRLYRDSCFIKFVMAFMGGMNPAAVYLGLYIDSAHWRRLVSDRGFDHVPDLVAPLVESFFPKRMVMDLHAFVVEATLGTGGHASVYRTRYKGKEVYALKKSIVEVLTDEVVSDFLTEALILHRVPVHPNIVALKGVCISPPCLCLVMDLCDMSLYDLIRKCRSKGVQVPVWLAVQLSMDIAQGMHHLHSQPVSVIHRDLKSLNVLLSVPALPIVRPATSCRLNRSPDAPPRVVYATTNTRGGAPGTNRMSAFPLRGLSTARPVTTRMTAKIADFGCSRLLSGAKVLSTRSPIRSASPWVLTPKASKRSSRWFKDRQLRQRHALLSGSANSQADMTGLLGTIPWAAPEVLRMEEYDIKSDVFSFGVVLWEIFATEEPRSDSRQFCIKDCAHGYRLPLTPAIPRKIQKLILECWEENPKQRPSFQKILTELKSFADDLPCLCEDSAVLKYNAAFDAPLLCDRLYQLHTGRVYLTG